MANRDPRIDAYIAKSADFAKPILQHFRAVVHEACPDVVETVKWGRPAFEHAGALMCSMVGFTRHCSLGFWKAPALTIGGEPVGFGASGPFARLTSLEDLPPRRALVKLVRRAATLNERGEGTSVMSGRENRPARAVVVPHDFARALAKNRRARETFEAFPPSRKREYVEWITGAKREQTRARRLAISLEWLADGKPQNWKYMK